MSGNYLSPRFGLHCVKFYGDTLEVVRNSQGIWVSLRKLCEVLGLDYSGQLQKLKKKPWARVEMISIPDHRGRKQNSAYLHLDSMPMWLATVEPSRVAPDVRPKLVRFQNECAQVLRDHFFGRPVERSVERSIEDPILALLQNAALTLQAVTQTRQAQLVLEHKVESVNALAVQAMDATVEANCMAVEAKKMAEAAMQAVDAETGFRTGKGYLKSKGVRMPTRMAAEHGKRLTKLCRERGILFRKAPDEIWDEVNSYPIELLDEYFGPILFNFGSN